MSMSVPRSAPTGKESTRAVLRRTPDLVNIAAIVITDAALNSEDSIIAADLIEGALELLTSLMHILYRDSILSSQIFDIFPLLFESRWHEFNELAFSACRTSSRAPVTFRMKPDVIGERGP
jgi:hypothetical protein